MRRLAISLVTLLAAACSGPGTGPEPSLAPRPAEAVDPRIPIANPAPSGPVDPAVASKLGELVGQVRAGVSSFDAQEVEATRLAATAGPMASESWVAAQQALSRLVEQYGVTTRAAADIDELASTQIDRQRWIRPGNRAAIAAAASEVGAISDRQAAAITRLKDQLAR